MRIKEVEWKRVVFKKPDGSVDRVILPQDLELFMPDQKESFLNLEVQREGRSGTYVVS